MLSVDTENLRGVDLLPDGTIPPFEERRTCPNRRRHKTITALFSQFRRRKSVGRRQEDKVGYIDVYGPRVWIFAGSVLALSVLDAVLTRREIASGMVQEANPVMKMALSWGGMYTFYGVKAALTALPLAVLVLHKEWPIAKFTAWICLWCYILIALYHIYLYFHFGCPA